MANEIAEKKKEFSMVLTDGLMENKEALPADFNIPRFVQNSVALLNKNDTLKNYAVKYGIAPIKMNLLRGAYLGLDALNSEFHLIPYGDKLEFIVDYRGARKLMMKYSVKPIADIFAEVVRQGDEYKRWSEDGVQHYKFDPMPFNGGVVTGAFAVCVFKDGTTLVEELSLKELEKIRNKSKMGRTGAWADFTEEMYKKSAIHRLKKRVSLDFDNEKQQEIFNEDGAIDTSGRVTEEAPDVFEEKEIYVESEVVEPTPSPQEVGEEDFDLPDFLKPES